MKQLKQATKFSKYAIILISVVLFSYFGFSYSISPTFLIPISKVQEEYKLNYGTIIPASSPIIINNDLDLTSFPGNGSAGAPYTIQDLNIDANGTGSCISISSTTKHVAILGCELSDSGNLFGDSGIEILHCENILVQNCTIFSHYFGMRVGFGKNITLDNCTFIECGGRACELYSCDNLSVTNTYFTEVSDGLALLGAEGASVINNTFSSITNHAFTCSGNGILIENNSVRSVFYGIDVNFANLTQVINNEFFNITQSAINISNSSSNVLQQNRIESVHTGLWSRGSSMLDIRNNTFRFSTNSAINFDETSNSTIQQNNFSFNAMAINFFRSSNENIASRNVFIGNRLNFDCLPSSIDNQWNDSSIGNYWDDYEFQQPSAHLIGLTWDEPYLVWNETGEMDYFPQYIDTVPNFWLEYTVQQDLITFSIKGCMGNGPCNIEWNVDGVAVPGILTIDAQLAGGHHLVQVSIEDTDGDFGIGSIKMLVVSDFPYSLEKIVLSLLNILTVVIVIALIISSIIFSIFKRSKL